MSHYFIGVDLGGTHLRAALVDSDTGELLNHTIVPAKAYEGYLLVIERMAGIIETVIRESRILRTEIGGVGIGIPGTADLKTGTILFLPNLPGQWRQVPLGSILKERLNLPVFLLNDVRSMTLGEWRFGAGKGVDTMACYAIGTGIGGGLVIDGKLHLGIGGTAGEIGHQIVEPNGIPCGCGGRGCLEMYCSGPAIASAGIKSVLHGHTTKIGELAGFDLNKINAEIVVKAAQQADQNAQEILQRAGFYLGIGIANILVAIGPRKIVIGGGVAEAGDLLFEPSRKIIRERVFMMPVEQVQIVQAGLGNHAGLIGAALWAKEYEDLIGK